MDKSIKRCPKCGLTKPRTTEFWGKHRTNGWQSACRLCCNASINERRQDQADPGEMQGLWKESDNKAELEKTVSTPVKTLEELIRVCEIDTKVWRVDIWECGAWTTTVSVKHLDTSGPKPVYIAKPEVVQNYRVRAKLARIIPRKQADMMDAVLARMNSHAFTYPKVAKFKIPTDAHLLEISLFDSHFGKLAWARETASDYDLKIAEGLYHSAVMKLSAMASPFPVERILFPVGSDFLHIDNQQNETFGGTPQDTDGRLAKIFETAQMAVVKAVDYLQGIAPVDLVWVPGNHDRTSSYFLVQALSAWYRNCPRVKVDVEPRPRKYIRYGKVLLGITHGNEERHASLPTIMASECPEHWGETTTRVWHVGHLHKKKQMHFMGTDTIDGVIVTTLPALCATDAWHHLKGYVNPHRAAEAYLWSKTRGYVGHFSANVAEDQKSVA